MNYYRNKQLSEEELDRIMDDPEMIEEGRYYDEIDQDESEEENTINVINYVFGLVLFVAVTLVLGVVVFKSTTELDLGDQNRFLLAADTQLTINDVREILVPTMPNLDKQKKKVLIIVDIQKDFMTGSLGAFKFGKLSDDMNSGQNVNSMTRQRGMNYGINIHNYIKNNRKNYDAFVYSIDFHPNDHCSFTKDTTCIINGNSTNPDSNMDNEHKWPQHCVQSDPTKGADLWFNIPYVTQGTDQDIIVADNDFKVFVDSEDVYKNYVETQKVLKLDPTKKDFKTFWLFKGRTQNVDSYSAFYGNHNDATQAQLDNISTGLKAALQDNNNFTPDNTEIHVLGIAYDYCVKSTALDASMIGYQTAFIKNLTVPIADTTETDDKLKTMPEEKNWKGKVTLV